MEPLTILLGFSLSVLAFSLLLSRKFREYPAFTCYVIAALVSLWGGFPRLKLGTWTVAQWVLMAVRAGVMAECIVHLTRGMWWRKQRRKLDLALLLAPAAILLMWPGGGAVAWLRHFQTVTAVGILLALLVLWRVRSSPESRTHAWILFVLMGNQAFDLWLWEWWPGVGRDLVLTLNYVGASACALAWVAIFSRPRILSRVTA